MTKVEFCKFLDKQDKNGIIRIKPLGYARNSIKKPTLPGWKDIISEIVVDKKYAKGLDGIEDYSHIIVVYWMDKEKECHLKHYPQGRKDVPYVGIFACRCPQRPNPIGISTTEIISIKDNTIKVKGLDVIDNTPILDIKPYTQQYDSALNAKVPEWVNKLDY